MLVLRWVLFLLLSAATDLVGVAPVAPVEAVEEGEEVLHGTRLRRPASVRVREAPVAQTQNLQPRLAAARARRVARVADPRSAGATVRKRPPSGSEPSSSVDDH